MYSYWNSD